jgi:hypothetical protein
MRAERDEIRPESARPTYTMHIVIGTVLVLALLLVVGLRDSDDLLEAPAAEVVRDSAIVEPPVVETAAPPALLQGAQDANAADTRRGDFRERQLPPPVGTVGAGEAQIGEAARGERLIIDGDLLKELEEDAEVRAGEASPNQLRTPQ